LESANQWLWLVFVIAGLLMASMELFIGIDTGLDLVFIGSSFIFGGLVTWPVHSWWVTVVVSGVACIAYVAIGRKYVHRWTASKKEKTNVDAIIGKHGIVLKTIGRNVIGLVKVGNEEWRAVADEEISEGSEIDVAEVKGVTLTVKKARGGK
jgi:membrane protein implicated in regulation of membrane protease activity